MLNKIRILSYARAGQSLRDKWLAALLVSMVSIGSHRTGLRAWLMRQIERSADGDQIELRLTCNGRPVSLFMRRGNEADYHIGGRLVKKTYGVPSFRPRTIIDGGANIGTFAIHAKTRFPDARLLCYEPDRSNFQQLSTNLSSNNLDVELHEAGLWSEAGVAHFQTRSSRTGFIGDGPDGVEVQVVRPVIGVDTWLKLDVEGAEYEILPSLVCADPRPRLITVEIHDFHARGEMLIRTLREAGYSIEGDIDPASIDPAHSCTTISARYEH